MPDPNIPSSTSQNLTLPRQLHNKGRHRPSFRPNVRVERVHRAGLVPVRRTLAVDPREFAASSWAGAWGFVADGIPNRGVVLGVAAVSYEPSEASWSYEGWEIRLGTFKLLLHSSSLSCSRSLLLVNTPTDFLFVRDVLCQTINFLLHGRRAGDDEESSDTLSCLALFSSFLLLVIVVVPRASSRCHLGGSAWCGGGRAPRTLVVDRWSKLHGVRGMTRGQASLR